mgnify:CR=1 FL=1
MKERSKLASFFLGKRIPIDKSKLNYKQLLTYEWDKMVRTITNIFIFLVYNGLMSLGWYGITTMNGGIAPVVNQVMSGTIYTGYVVGHVCLNGVHWITNKFTKEKTRQDMVDSGNPIPKKSGFSIFTLTITIVPFIIYLIGKCVIISKCKKYVVKNGSLETEAQKRAYNLESQKVDQTVATNIAASIVKELVK